MWGSFIAAACLIVALVFPPRFLVLRGLDIRADRALACAPLFNLLVYSALAIVYAKAGIASTWLSLAVPCYALSALCFGVEKTVAQRRRNRTVGKRAKPSANHKPTDPWDGLRQGAGSLALYLVAGITATTALFVVPIGSADSFICGFDIAHHMSLARSFADSGN